MTERRPIVSISGQRQELPSGDTLPNAPKLNATTTNPGTGNDNTQGYAVGSYWINTSTKEIFFCISAATGAAVWGSTTRNYSQAIMDSYVGSGSTGTRILRYTNVSTTGSDITITQSSVSGDSFTINNPGVYSGHNVGYRTDNSVMAFGFSLNATSLSADLSALAFSEVLSAARSASSAAMCTSSFTAVLAAGDVVRPHWGVTVPNFATGYLSYSRITRVG